MKQENIDTLLVNVRIVDVFRMRTFPGWVGILDGRFQYVEEGQLAEGIAADRTIDCDDAFLVPGLVDTHMHIESSHMLPRMFAEAVLPQGTTAVLADPHEIANLAGKSGVEWLINASDSLPLTIFFAAPSVVPIVSRELETPNAELSSQVIERICAHPRVLSIGEIHDYNGVAAGEPRLMALGDVSLRTGLKIEGHIPELMGCDLSRYVSLGVTSDHTLFSPDQLLEELSKGLYVMLQRKALTEEIISVIAELPDRSRILFVTDDVSPSELLDGHLLSIVSLGITLGLSPIEALASATIRAATYLGLHRHGAIAPGRRADCWTTRSIDTPTPMSVFVKGALVARDGKVVEDTFSGAVVEPIKLTAPPVPGLLNEEDMRLVPEVAGEARISTRAVELLNRKNSLTGLTAAQVTVRDGHPILEAGDDLCIIGVFSRTDPKSRSIAMLKGFGLTQGGVASSVAHDTHNLIVVGRDAQSMATAAREVHRLGGGIAFATGARIESALPLPIAGLMSDAGLQAIVCDAQAVEASLKMHGVCHREPLLVLTLLALSVSPHYKVTDRGIVDVRERRIVPPLTH
ncbi:adenine deaminase C-terminal domain-containing protein [Candidatus Bipolaricaulota bacterium]